MRMRLKGPGGTANLTLADDATVGDLIDQIREKTAVSSFEVKYGFPPNPLLLDDASKQLKELGVKLDGESLTISPRDAPAATKDVNSDMPPTQNKSPSHRAQKPLTSAQSVAFVGMKSSTPKESTSTKPVPLQKKAMAGEVPETPLPERGATLVLRVMPDDNSCLFRAFCTAVLPGDDLGMPELRSIIASGIQGDPEKYTTAVLEQSADDYCRWIQTEDAWGGAIEMTILSEYFDIQICSVDVQSLRIDRYNEAAHNICILVYSGIHYDTIVQSPSEPPHTKANNPPEFDLRIWDANDEYILTKAVELCENLQKKHYYTDTGGMAIKCNICGQVVYGEKQASGHAQHTGHYDMAEVTT